MASFKVKLVVYFVLLSIAPLTAAFLGFSSVAQRSEERRVDARLEAGLRAALAAYQDEIATLSRAATALAREPGFQDALRNRDYGRLRLLERETPGLHVRPSSEAGPLPFGSGERAVAVVSGGRLIGEVVLTLSLDRALLDRIHARSGLDADDRLAIVRTGRVGVGPPGTAGRVLGSATGRTSVVSVGDTRYRTLVAPPVPDPPGTSFAVLTPQAEIDRANREALRPLLAGLLVSLALIALVAYFLGRSIVRTLRRLVDAAHGIARGRLHERVAVGGRDEFAMLGEAFNDMAEQLQQRMAELEGERRRLRDLTMRFGDALAATHDIDQLRHVIVETAVESTGARGGLLVGGPGSTIESGAPGAGAQRIELPLQAGRESFGILVLTGDDFGLEERETAASLAGQAVVALENARLHAIVERQALVDSLTGLSNRRRLGEALRSELTRAERLGTTLSIVLADLDNFKSVNDRFGHPAGDGVLREFADTVRSTVREIDLAGRWGGEEFAIVLPGADTAGAAALAERLRARFEGRIVLTADGTHIPVTASFGVASYPDFATEAELVEAADAALYEAKRSGKNRVSCASDGVRRP